MISPLRILIVLALLCPGAAFAQSEDADLPPVPMQDGSESSGETPLFYEVPTETKPQTQTPEQQHVIDQAIQNQQEYLDEAKQRSVLRPDDDTVYGAIPTYIPFSPYSPGGGGNYSFGGNYYSPFVNRSYSYGGTYQSFGAPMFVGQELPNPWAFYQPYPSPYPLPLGGIYPSYGLVSPFPQVIINAPLLRPRNYFSNRRWTISF